MESLKSPSPTTIAMGALVTVWAEVARRRVSLWVGIRDTMEILERRRVLAKAQKVNTRLPKGKPEPKPEPAPDEAWNAYHRMRDSRRRPTFTPDF